MPFEVGGVARVEPSFARPIRRASIKPLCSPFARSHYGVGSQLHASELPRGILCRSLSASPPPNGFHDLTANKNRVSAPQSRIPSAKSSIGVLSPRLFCRRSPSTSTSKRFVDGGSGISKVQSFTGDQGKTGDLSVGVDGI
jgi:hypothetical protein